MYEESKIADAIAAIAPTDDEKKMLLYFLVKHFLGQENDREYGIPSPDGEIYAFVTPPQVHARRNLTSDRERLLDRRTRGDSMAI